MMESQTSRTSRLRRAFGYVADDSDSVPEHLDEDEQDALIAQFRDLDSHLNTVYTRLFTIIYLIPIVNSIFHLFTHPSTIELLSLASYMLTTYSINFVPIRPSKSKGKQRARESLLSKIGLSDDGEFLGRINKFIPYLNICLGAAIAIGHYNSVSGMRKKGVEVVFYREYIGYLPLILFVMSIIVKRVMASVDISELEEKRYKLKGA